MDVAIVAPSPTPFVMGGAEHLWLGLQRYIVENTVHACELIKLPTRERSFTELLQSYRLHARNDLNHFDRIITTKYPAWMTRHRNHAVYMQHKLRGLYDTYHFSREPVDLVWPEGTNNLQEAVDSLFASLPDDDGSRVERVIDLLDGALSDGRISAELARFPGPLARHVVHALDHQALHPSRIAQYTAISHTVRQRAHHFPRGVDVAVLYHPPRLQGLHCGGDDHLFTVSRLDGPKRIGLLVEAMRHVRARIPLLIGGVGPDEARLRQLAEGDPRIRFLGAMSDDQVREAYAQSLAVPFVPYDEDLGLVTLEAMMSGKPVITVHDAGGVTEFVEHGQTGLCVAPEPEVLGRAIDHLCAHRAEARAMGLQARRRVAGITWQAVAERLLDQPLTPRPGTRDAKPAQRKRLAVALTFAIDPPRGGGQSRVFHLYRALAEQMDVTLVCLTGADNTFRHQEIAPGLVEIRVPRTAAHQQAEDEAGRSVHWVPVTDIVAAREIHHTPQFLEVLDDACLAADAVVASHPYFAGTLRERYPDKPMIFEAHNVEILLKQTIMPAIPASEPLLELVRQNERLAWQEASLVMACATQDLAQLAELYGATSAVTLEVPNGFAENEVRRLDAAARASLRQQVGLGDEPVALFLGSWHGPNLEAVECILGYAAKLPDVCFVVVGSACAYFQSRSVPDNVRLVGIVDEAEKQVFLSVADIALNPMTSGSGSNLKMLDYFAAGVPVMSTPFGARGIEAQPELHYLASEIDEFPFRLLRWLVERDNCGLSAMVERAEGLAQSRYGWQNIGREASRFVLSHLRGRGSN